MRRATLALIEKRGVRTEERSESRIGQSQLIKRGFRRYQDLQERRRKRSITVKPSRAKKNETCRADLHSQPPDITLRTRGKGDRDIVHDPRVIKEPALDLGCHNVKQMDSQEGVRR